ncbi:MAG: GNAT family N-acetyltransferase [Cyanophyceae cyanobacterium]
MNDAFALVFPCLETERLWLRSTTKLDAEAILAIFSDPQVTQYHDLAPLTDISQALEIVERRAKGFARGVGIRWGIAQKPI